MWISRYRWESLVQRVERCEKAIRYQRDEMNEKIINMAKEILRQPEELSKELDSMDDIDNFVEEFINR